MLFGSDRTQMRRFLGQVWRKKKTGAALEPLERLIAAVIAQHPEYQPLLEGIEKALDQDFDRESGASNPFLHLGMHIAIQEQLTSDRPSGILAVYQTLCRRCGDAHRAEHQMMDVLGEILWLAQRDKRAPDEELYLQKLKSYT